MNSPEDGKLTRRRLLKGGMLSAAALLGRGKLQAAGSPALPVRPLPAKAGQYKTYPQAKQIDLPEDFSLRGLPVEETIQRRRSVRIYAAEPISLLELSRLLHYASGITSESTGFRAAPSAGATYPMELYPVVHRVASLEQGLYHYAVKEHKLELIEVGNYEERMVDACLRQGFVGSATVALALTGIYRRTQRRYGQRGVRYVHMEAGFMGENLYLAARSMGMGVCAVGAFDDRKLAALLGVVGKEEVPLLVLAIGKLAG